MSILAQILEISSKKFTCQTIYLHN